MQWEHTEGPFTHQDPQRSLKGEIGKGVEMVFQVENMTHFAWVHKAITP